MTRGGGTNPIRRTWCKLVAIAYFSVYNPLGFAQCTPTVIWDSAIVTIHVVTCRGSSVQLGVCSTRGSPIGTKGNVFKFCELCGYLIWAWLKAGCSPLQSRQSQSKCVQGVLYSQLLGADDAEEYVPHTSEMQPKPGFDHGGEERLNQVLGLSLASYSFGGAEVLFGTLMFCLVRFACPVQD